MLLRGDGRLVEVQDRLEQQVLLRKRPELIVIAEGVLLEKVLSGSTWRFP